MQIASHYPLPERLLPVEGSRLNSLCSGRAYERSAVLRLRGGVERHGVRNGRLRRTPQTEHGREVRPPYQPVVADRLNDYAKIGCQCLHARQ